MEKPSTKDGDWFHAHYGEIYDNYVGKVVAVYGQRVVASSDTRKALLNYLKRNNYRPKEMIIVLVGEKEKISVCV
jgi:hypothetical protein